MSTARRSGRRLSLVLLALGLVVMVAGCSFKWPVGKPCPAGSYRAHSLITGQPVFYCTERTDK